MITGTVIRMITGTSIRMITGTIIRMITRTIIRMITGTVIPTSRARRRHRRFVGPISPPAPAAGKSSIWMRRAASPAT